MNSNNRDRDITIREMLVCLNERPGMYLASNEKKLNRLSHFVDGWLLNNKVPQINHNYHMGITHYISDWIMKNKCIDVSQLQLLGPKYKMIYAVTRSDEEAWELFFKISYEYLDYLEAEDM